MRERVLGIPASPYLREGFNALNQAGQQLAETLVKLGKKASAVVEFVAGPPPSEFFGPDSDEVRECNQQLNQTNALSGANKALAIYNRRQRQKNHNGGF